MAADAGRGGSSPSGAMSTSSSPPRSRSRRFRSAGRTQSRALEQLYRNTEFTPFTAVANLTGLPATSLPLHWTDAGLPIGVQAIAPAGRCAPPQPRGADRSRAAVGRPRTRPSRSDQDAIVIRICLPGRRMQHACRAPGDRERHVPVAVLVQDHVSRSRVRERPGHDRVVPLTGELELDAGSRDDSERLDVVAVEVERDVAEAVDVEQRRIDRIISDDRLWNIEADQALGSTGGPSSASGTPSGEVRGRRREEIAAMERPRDRLERVLRDSRARGQRRCPLSPRRAAGAVVRPDVEGRPSASRSASGRRGPPTPGSTIARCTPTGMKPIVFARTSAP